MNKYIYSVAYREGLTKKYIALNKQLACAVANVHSIRCVWWWHRCGRCPKLIVH